MHKGKNFFYVRESAMQSIASDTYTLFVGISGIAINEYLLNSSTFGAWLFGLIIFLWILAK